MVLLIAGLVLFFAVHGLKIHVPGRRVALAQRVGNGPVMGMAALLLLASVAMMVQGYGAADYIELWSAPGWMRHLNNLMMLIAIGLFIAGPPKSWLADKIRHPQLAGVKLWALAHLLVKGDLASTLLFGGLLAWAVIAMIGINLRDGKAPLPRRSTATRSMVHAILTLVVFASVAWVHTHLGYPPLGGGA